MKNAITYKVNDVYHGYGDIRHIDFTLLHRKKDLCLFKRSDGYFEVVQLRHQKEGKRVIDGRDVIFKEKEIYPYGDKWDGKCMGTYERALEYYENN